MRDAETSFYLRTTNFAMDAAESITIQTDRLTLLLGKQPVRHYFDQIVRSHIVRTTLNCAMPLIMRA